MNRFSPSMRRWALAVASLTGLQALLLHYGVVQVQAIRPPPLPGPQVSVLMGNAFGSFTPLFQLASPILFSLPVAQGFSGSGWLNRPSPVPIETLEEFPPTWLEMSTSGMGQALQSQIALTRAPSTPVADLAVEWRDSFPADEPISRKSTLRIEGDLKSRELLTPVSLPSWAHPDVPADSHVAVIVDADGWVKTATFVEPEGEATLSVFGPRDRLLLADQFAQTLTQTLRFKPSRPRTSSAVLEEPIHWTSGRLIFHWSVLPPLAGNKPSVP